MGTIDQGVLGAVSGKVGPVVGARRRGQNTLRSTGRKRKLKSEIPQNQTYKLGLMSTFLSRAQKAIEIGFSQNKKKIDPLNRAISYNIPLAIIGEAPNYTIDYSEIVFSIGKRETAWSAELILQLGAKAAISWEIPETAKLKVIGKDHAYLVIFDATSNQFVPQTQIQERASLSCAVK